MLKLPTRMRINLAVHVQPEISYRLRPYRFTFDYLVPHLSAKSGRQLIDKELYGNQAANKLCIIRRWQWRFNAE